MTQTNIRPASLTVAALAAGALLALAPVGASAQPASDSKAVGKAAALKMIKRLDLKLRHSPRGTAKRPPRRSRPTPRSKIARTFNGECQINHIPTYYPNSTVSPYTWAQYQVNGAWQGFYLLNRYGLTFGAPNQPRLCGYLLGTQAEVYRVIGGQWRWWKDVNCDYYGSTCWVVRSA